MQKSQEREEEGSFGISPHDHCLIPDQLKVEAFLRRKKKTQKEKTESNGNEMRHARTHNNNNK